FTMVSKRELWSSAWITLIGAKLSVIRKIDGSIAIDGIAGSNDSPHWLLQGEKFAMLNSEISWHDQKTKAKPLLFNADLVLKNAGAEHQLNVISLLPKQYGTAVRVSMQLTGNSFEPAALHGRVYVEGKHLQLAELITGTLPSGSRIQSGTADVQLWTDWQQDQAIQMTGSLQLQQGKFAQRDKSTYAIKELSTRFHGQKTGAHWRLLLDELAVTTPAKTWPKTQLALSAVTNTEQALEQLGVFADSLELQEFAELAQLFAPLSEVQQKFVADSRIKGRLQNLSGFVDLTKQTGAINTRFNKLSMTAVGAAPGIDSISGTIKGNQEQGVFSLSAENAQLTAPMLFRAPLSLNLLKGALTWRQTPTAWQLGSKRLVANLPGVSTETHGQLQFSKNAAQPTLDLNTVFTSTDMSQVPLSLPTEVMSTTLVDWLDHAFVGGRIPKGEFQLRGNMAKFPFMDGSGLFKVQFEVEQLALTYHPDWPQLKDLLGTVVFTKKNMQIDLRQGLSEAVKV
ncbi:MAG: DUF3971 domain-containing protein, partial [Methylococcales bacterium]